MTGSLGREVFYQLEIFLKNMQVRGHTKTFFKTLRLKMLEILNKIRKTLETVKFGDEYMCIHYIIFYSLQVRTYP